MSGNNVDNGSASATSRVSSAKTSNVMQEEEDNRALEETLNLARMQAVGKEKRLNERSVYVQREAKRLRAEADRLDREAVQLQSSVDDAKELRKTLTFESLLLRLRRNDADAVVVNGKACPPGYAQAIGKALDKNVKVSTLDLIFPLCLSSTAEPEMEQEMEPLLQFISKSSSLIDLNVQGNDDDECDYRTISRGLLKAISKCARLKRLSWQFPVDASLFPRMMTRLQALQELDIRFFVTSLSESERRTIASAFQSANSLEKLKLWTAHGRDFTSLILLTVAETSPPLQELAVENVSHVDGGFYPALYQVLRSISTIERFEMVDFILSEENMTELLDALQLQNLSRFSFRKCEVVEPGELVLPSFLQTRTTDDDGAIVVISNLRELHISAGEEEELTEDVSRHFADSILAAVQGAGESETTELDNARPLYLPTIGSQLEHLSLGIVNPSFFDVLRDNADRVRLQSLELVGLSQAACVAFGKCIPYQTTIRKLKFAKVDSDGIVWLLHGLKNNGSICHVVATNDGNDDNEVSDFSPTQLRLIDAYCLRNQLLNQLIESEPSPDGQTCDSSTGTDASSETVAEVATHHHAELVVRPPLLQAAMQIPNSRLTALTRGLLVLGQSFNDEY